MSVCVCWAFARDRILKLNQTNNNKIFYEYLKNKQIHLISVRWMVSNFIAEWTSSLYCCWHTHVPNDITSMEWRICEPARGSNRELNTFHGLLRIISLWTFENVIHSDELYSFACKGKCHILWMCVFNFPFCSKFLATLYRVCQSKAE